MSEASSTAHASEKALKRLRKRRAADVRFQFYGLAAVTIAMSALVILIVAIGTQAISAATQNVLTFDIVLRPDAVAPDGDDGPDEIARNVEGFYGLIREDLLERFPEARESRALRLEVSGLVTRLAVLPLAKRVAATPELIGETERVKVPIADDIDLFLKSGNSSAQRVDVGPIEKASIDDEGRLQLQGSSAFRKLNNLLVAQESFDIEGGSVLVSAGKSTVRLISLETPSLATGALLTGTADDFAAHPSEARVMRLPETERTYSDRQVAWTLALKADGRIRKVPHTSLLTHTDSTYPELAGALAAIVGSMLTMFITALVAIPIGILASVYLEEFAPKNRLTDIIEVNINNLAAVPSIVFGLLGAAVFLGVFGLPRSAPLVGGLVLALLILPVVIIASRAALRTVPPSIRTGALAVGASQTQAVFHHVLPLAAPGMLTGAILGMARALGETAPLLLIGMVAFVAEVPTGVQDESTALPVLIYSWATNAERAWEPMTAAVIVVLLAILISMNAFVVFLRRKFERRW